MPRPKATPRRPGFTEPHRWEVVIPDWHPTSLNVLMRLHWSRRIARTASEADLVAGYCFKAGVPTATCKRRVTQRLTLAGRDKIRDDDNAWKGLLDALAAAYMLVDDAPAWVERAALIQERGPRRKTTITLEDLPCA